MATSTGDIDQWVEIAKECKYLPENDLKVVIMTLFEIIISKDIRIYFLSYSY